MKGAGPHQSHGFKPFLTIQSSLLSPQQHLEKRFSPQPPPFNGHRFITPH